MIAVGSDFTTGVLGVATCVADGVRFFIALPRQESR
jgi:hypothetical protein